MPAHAQQVPPEQVQPQPPQSQAEQAPPIPPAMPHECQTPGLNITGDVPLPHVTRALKDRKVLKILTIGASSKGGKGSGDLSYYSIIEGVLEKIMPGLDVKILDRGISGELARDAFQRLQTEVALLSPDLVLWQLGTHDALMQVSVDEFGTTVAEALDWLHAHNVDVVIVGLHYLRKLALDPHYQAIRAALNRVADEKKVLRIIRYEAMQLIEQARRASSGGVANEFMLTEEGYGCLSEYVVRAVTSGVFARSPRSGPKG